jgi:hypothetical protein
MRNYTIFVANFRSYLIGKGLKLPGMITKDGYKFENNILNGLLNCHLFEVTDDLKRLLILTKTPKQNDMLKLPFPVIFIDARFTKKEMDALGVDIGFDEINGIIVQEGNIYRSSDGKEIGTDLRVSISAINYRSAWIFETYMENMNFYEEYRQYEGAKRVQENGLNKKARRFIKGFVLNFLNFIYNPEVKYVTVEADKKRNLKRIERDKLPIPPRNFIKLSGVLKRYTDELRNNPVWHYNYRFWVHGFFRTLRNEKYGVNVGKRLWIAPFIKGKGLLIEKEYLVDKPNEDVDEI